MYENFRTQPVLAKEVSDFLTLAAVSEARAYPVSAKYHFDKTDIPMSLVTRSKSVSLLDENARHEIDSLIRMETAMRTKLGLKG
jgi:4-hydroxy-tetrahydrodipicolinate synthase